MRAPKASSEVVSRVMKANKGRDTGPELLVRKAIWAAGHRGYRTNWRKAPGRPDIAFVGKKVAVIVHGCFWHGCPKCTKRTPKTNESYWSWKFKSNKARDRKNKKLLAKQGWEAFEIWEHDVKKGKVEGMLEWLKEKV